MYYGAASSESQTFADRLTKIIDSDGTLILEYRVSGVGTHPQEVLDDLLVIYGD